MAQSHPWSVMADPAFLQILSLLEALDVPVAAIDTTGHLLFESASFSALRKRGADVDESSPLQQILIRDCVVSADRKSLPFLESGGLDLKALPFTGKCRVHGASGDASEEFFMRLEPYRDLSGSVETAICVIQQGGLPSATGELLGSKAASPAFSLLRRWQPRIEEIGDSFDVERIGAKTRGILREVTDAGAVAFYWLNGDIWERVGEAGEVEKTASVPDQILSSETWISLVTGHSPISLGDLARLARKESRSEIPGWMRRRGEGFALACKARGDALGLVIGWTQSPRWSSAAALDLLDLVCFQAAQAIDYARWFQYARQSDSRSDQFIDSANAIILGLDLRGEVTLWNRKSQEIFGYSREEMVGRPVGDVLGVEPQEQEKIAHTFRSVLDGGDSLVSRSLNMRDKAGELHDIEWNTSTLTSTRGAILGCYAIGQDVTRRKELEQSLEKSERRYRSLVESTHDLYWTIRFIPGGSFEQGRLTFLNREFAGQSAESLIGRGVEAMKPFFAPESWERFKEGCHQVFRTGRPVPYIETECVEQGPDSKQVFLRSDLFPQFEDDQLIGVQALSIDVTEHKQIEAQALQAQKLESIGTLAMGVAHDFNNILHGVSGFSYLISRNPNDPDRVLANLKAIQDLTDRASRLTRQLQSYANQASPQKHVLDLNEVVRQSVSILDVGVARHIDVQTEFWENLPWIDADRSQIEQILLNLFINAVEAMGDTGTLTVATRLIRGETNQEDLPLDAPWADYSVLEVRDTGCGMTPEVKARIFDPFFTTKRTGHGLGLSSVFGIIKRHNAFIRVNSEPGKGTCFIIYFPSIEESRRLLAAGQETKVRGGNETILFVDDEPAIRLVSEDILTGLGYRVILAENGEEAVKILRARPNAIDLVLVDIAMPVLNGRAAAKIMRMARPDLRVLFTSGHSDAETIESLHEDGYHHFLAKPYSMLDLQSAVRKALDAPTCP